MRMRFHSCFALHQYLRQEAFLLRLHRSGSKDEEIEFVRYDTNQVLDNSQLEEGIAKQVHKNLCVEILYLNMLY